jgi:hypothetical protein
MVKNKIEMKFSMFFLFKGECPILTGEIAVAFNKGIMGYAKLEDTQLEYGIYKVIPVMR